MNPFAEFPPALILLLGALLVPFLKGNWKSVYVIALPALTLLYILQLDSSEGWKFNVFSFTDEAVDFLRVDKLSKAFGIIFSLNAVIAFVFAFYVKNSTQHVAALVYIGSAIGTVFAGDLVSVYVFWEGMAISSTFVILSRKTEKAKAAGFRYIMVHLLGGLFLLAGIVITVANQGGSIAFNGFDFATEQHAGTWLILIGILVNAGAPPLSAWLPDSYPEASVTGGLILSAYTTKTAVYTLLRGYPGWEPLIWIGCAMSVYGIIYALLENDMRRILAYSIINQVGFMVCAAGIGSPEAISGATAHAFCHIIYKSLLWMSAGAVLYRIGKSKCTDLGGLYKTMPLTLIFGTIGALAISAVPGTSGFTSKTIIIHAAEYSDQAGIFWAWLILEAASAGVFLHAGIKFPYFVFFNKDQGHRPKEAPGSMLIAMFILSFLCIFFGIYPQPLYDLLPYAVDYNAYTWSHIITQMQLLMLSALVFFLFLPMLKRTATISLDFDWFYRKALPPLGRGLDKTLNGTNAAVSRGFTSGVIAPIVNFFESGASRFVAWILTPFWMSLGYSAEKIDAKQQSLFKRAKRGAFPIGITAFFAVILLGLLSLIFLLEK
ncbi:MAG: Na(+)/H(+) antiporter subunit D [Verrucomicrobiales bacterium]|nr:Na(+)/H(+) antiporter subunit D [Verrucomicrobiales bacterium]